jgi:hypothetical protein
LWHDSIKDVVLGGLQYLGEDFFSILQSNTYMYYSQYNVFYSMAAKLFLYSFGSNSQVSFKENVFSYFTKLKVLFLIGVVVVVIIW